MAGRVRRFNFWLALIVLAALGIRLLYALVVMRGVGPLGDGYEFHLLGGLLADEGRYMQPLPFLHHGGEVIPTAEKPPGYPAFLALATKLGASSYPAHRAASCLLGAATVGVLGLLGRRLGGDRAGLVAAGIGAVYPMLVVLDGSVRSESLYVLLVALALLAAYRLIDGGRWPAALALGAMVGLAALTRSEAILLIPLLALPAAWLVRAPGRRRLALGAVACLGCLLVIAPYQVRNLSTFERPVFLSTNEGGLLAGANCRLAYYGEEIGTWPCFPRNKKEWGTDESVISWHLRKQAVGYALSRKPRMPVVAGVRVLRTWDLWDTLDQARLEERNSERNIQVHEAGLAVFYLLAALAVYGVVVLRRRGVPVLPLLAPPVLVTVVSALTWGSTRFRAVAEVSIVVLAALALTQLAERRARRRAPA